MARRAARKAAAAEAESAPASAVALDRPADPEAAERAQAVEVAEVAAEAQPASTDDDTGTPAAGTDDGEDRTAIAATADPAPTDSDGDSGQSEADRPGAGQSSDGQNASPSKPARRRRTPKLDPLLAAEVDVARQAVLTIAPESQVGEHAGVRAEDDRVVTHLFESNLRGYAGWQWFAVLARVPRGKTPTVSEVGILPSERSVLAPDWVPWAERVRPEEKQAEAEQAKAEQAEAEAKNAQDDAGQDDQADARRNNAGQPTGKRGRGDKSGSADGASKE